METGTGTAPNGWSRYEALVLEKLRRLERQQDNMRDDMNTSISDLKTDVAVLKFKCGLAGGGGALVVLLGKGALSQLHLTSLIMILHKGAAWLILGSR